MKKYYKLLIIPAIIIIIAGFFSGFSRQSCIQAAENLLKERTKVMHETFSGRLEREQAEQLLTRIETYPLLSEDISSLREFEDSDLDTVQSMAFIEVSQENKQFDYTVLRVKIRWYMRGYNGDYITDNDYTVILEAAGDGYRLSEFSSLKE